MGLCKIDVTSYTAVIQYVSFHWPVRRFMKISWHGNDVCITGPLWGESTNHWWIHLTQGPVMQSCDVSFIINLNKLLNKQLIGLWFARPWCSCDSTVMCLHCFYTGNPLHGYCFFAKIEILLITSVMLILNQAPEVSCLCQYWNRLQIPHSWWCHDMEILSTLLAICVGNPSVTSGIPHKKCKGHWFKALTSIS